MNFSLFIFILFIISGCFWLINKIFNIEDIKENKSKFNKKNISNKYIIYEINNLNTKKLIINFIRNLSFVFPSIFLVFIIRSFILEPFKIPSASMMPNLISGDFILVNKFCYGIKFPIFNKKIISISLPKRGDIVVFRYPKDTSLTYIKRVIGLPGDVIEYKNNILFINNKLISKKQISANFSNKFTGNICLFKENIKNKKHIILDNCDSESDINNNSTKKDFFEYNTYNIKYKIPSNNYFMLGDNRNNSSDSRYWGFVEEKNIIGRAFFIWMNFSNLNRIGWIS